MVLRRARSPEFLTLQRIPVGDVEFDWTYPVVRGLIGCFPLTPSIGTLNLADTSTITTNRANELQPPFTSTAIGPAMLCTGSDGSSNAFVVECGFNQVPIMSVSAWVSVSSTVSTRAIFGGEGSGSMEFLQPSAARTLQLIFTGAAVIGTSTGSVPTGGVHHVGCSYNSVSGAWAFYIDGRQDSTGVQAETLGTGSIAKIGCTSGPFGPGDPWQGTISNVNIYNRVLSRDEFFILYSNPFGMLRPVARRVFRGTLTAAATYTPLGRPQIQIWDH
jgi:hypothetical protein